jgi:tetratricopeptide (TPR) repeat protein
MPGMRAPLRLSALLLLAALPLVAADPVAVGDAAWARRAEGHQGDRAAPGAVDQAIAAYQRALQEQPDRLEAVWKLLRALHYKGDYAVQGREGKQQVFSRGREVFEAALERIGRRVGGRGKLDELPPPQVAKLASGIPEAPAVFLWGAIHWGLWGDSYGRIAAARQGVGDKIRRYGEVALALDERYDHAGAHRLLGRLHTLAPKIPLVTGWVSRDEAVSHLRRAVALAPDDLLNQVYLADALLQYQAERSAEAREILRRVLQKKPDPERVVEDERALAEARKLLGGP